MILKKFHFSQKVRNPTKVQSIVMRPHSPGCGLEMWSLVRKAAGCNMRADPIQPRASALTLTRT